LGHYDFHAHKFSVNVLGYKKIVKMQKTAPLRRSICGKAVFFQKMRSESCGYAAALRCSSGTSGGIAAKIMVE